MARDSEPLEVFTDLSGNVDDAPADNDAALLEKDLMAGKVLPKEEIKDEELQVLAESEDGEAVIQPGEEVIPAEDEEEEEAEAQPQVVSDFDPKDVTILLKDNDLVQARKVSATEAKTRADADMASAVTRLKAAKEAGDTDKDIEETQNYAKAMNAAQTATNTLAGIANEEAQLKTRAETLYAKAPKDEAGKPILTGEKQTPKPAEKSERPSKLTPKFKAANAWFGNTKYKAQTDRLMAIDRGLAAEGGFHKDTPEYFVELGKRMNREYPGLYKNLDGKPVATGTRTRSGGTPIPNGGGGGGGGGGGNGGGGGGGAKVGLVASDLAEMRKFGMDPDNMGHRREWLVNKRALSSGRAA